MCLGIPGQIMEVSHANAHLARVEVSGVGRTINIGLLEDEGLVVGDWVLIHVGFAMSRIDEDEARLAMASLQIMGESFTDEVTALITSPSSAATATASATSNTETNRRDGATMGVIIGWMVGNVMGTTADWMIQP